MIYLLIIGGDILYFLICWYISENFIPWSHISDNSDYGKWILRDFDMKLSKAQENELKVLEYFMPKNVKWLPKTDRDIEMFFEWSEQGKHKEKKIYGDISYFEGLREGKSWAGVHMGMYEDGVLEGTMPYTTILGGFEGTTKRKWWQFWKPKISFFHKPIPRYVVDFMKKEMFKGIDAEVIEICYSHLSSCA